MPWYYWVISIVAAFFVHELWATVRTRIDGANERHKALKGEVADLRSQVETMQADLSDLNARYGTPPWIRDK